MLHKLWTGLIAWALLLPALGCVAVQAPLADLDDRPIPAGETRVLIATPHEMAAPADTNLAIALNDTLTLPLQLHAINHVTLPAGWYRLQLLGVATGETGSDVSYRFDEGQSYRFVIVSRTVETAKDSTDPGDRIIQTRIVPVSRDALHNLVIETSYPIVDVKN